MSRMNILFLVLLVAFAVVTIIAMQDPNQAARLDQMRRDVAFTGEAREIAMIVFFLGVGGFVAYLLFSRR
jgi:hypothetical protein